MTEYSERLLTEVPRTTRIKKFRPYWYVVIPLVAILFQVYVPRFFEILGNLELPLLVTVYFALMSRRPTTGALLGAGIGLGQDSLSFQNVGMFGIVKTLVGYFASSVSMRFDVDNPLIQFVLSFFFFLFHQFFYWVLARALLGLTIDFSIQRTLLFGLANAIVAIPLFLGLDRVKETG
jgi:rod shape-determining protein MreD